MSGSPEDMRIATYTRFPRGQRPLPVRSRAVAFDGDLEALVEACAAVAGCRRPTGSLVLIVARPGFVSHLSVEFPSTGDDGVDVAVEVALFPEDVPMLAAAVADRILRGNGVGTMHVFANSGNGGGRRHRKQLVRRAAPVSRGCRASRPRSEQLTGAGAAR